MMVGDGHYGEHNPMVVVEGGQNHNGDLASAKELVDACMFADAYKTQIHIPGDEMIKSLMPTVYQRISQHALSIDEEFELRDYVQSKGLLYVCTCFSETAYQYVPELNPDALKVGSGEANNHFLLSMAQELATSLRIPLMISNGMSLGYPAYFGDHVIDMVCESIYPSNEATFRLPLMRALSQSSRIWGYSCHTVSPIEPTVAFALGAQVMEFHTGFEGCHDDKVSWRPHDLMAWMQYTQNLACHTKPFDDAVKRWATHCYVATDNIKKGERIKDRITTKRPGFGGLPADMWHVSVMRRIALQDIEAGEQLTEENCGQDSGTDGVADGSTGTSGGRSPEGLEAASRPKTIH